MALKYADYAKHHGKRPVMDAHADLRNNEDVKAASPHGVVTSRLLMVSRTSAAKR
jgi:arginase family enzyme